MVGMRRALKCGLLAVVLCLQAPFAAAAGASHVLLLLSEPHGAYQRFRQTFEQNLPAATRLEVRVLQEKDALPDADLLVTVGGKAAEWAAQHAQSPLLATMLSSDSYQQIRQGSRSPSSALYLDQPWSRQVALIRAALPERQRVGVLYSSDNARVLPELRQALAQQGAQMVALPVSSVDQLAPVLESLLGQSDLLMAVPDNTIYNSYTIRNILLGSYRRGVPLIGLSAAYVNAGALCAVYASVEQQAEQATRMTATFLATRRLPAPQFPHDYQIAINAEVARSLGVSLPPMEVLRRRIDEGERVQ